MRKEGVKISYLDVDHEANIDLNMLSELLRKQVTMVSVMTANNEIGTVSQYRRIGIMAREYGALYHTDAVCAFGKIPIDVNKDHIDMLSATAHKIHGPKGVGLLYVGKNVKIEPMIYGGGQEGGYRSGTENVPGIVGFAKAAMISFKRMEYRHSVVRKFRDYMVSCILTIKGAYLLGSKSSCLDHTMCFAFEGVYGETLLMLLNERKICVSNGSACHANSDGASHVLMAMGVDKELLYNTIRISIDDNITKYEIDMTVKAIREIVDIIREKERE